MSKPSWDYAPEWANWLAMDADGDWYWYAMEPTINAWDLDWNPQFDMCLLAYSPQAEKSWTETKEGRP